MLASTTVNAEEDSAELRQFREQWKFEVRRRREELQHAELNLEAHARSHPPPPPPPPPPPSSSAPPLPPATEVQPPVTRSVATSASPPLPAHTSHGQSSLGPNVLRAIEIYRSAVQHEQESNLDEALRLYRQAFRLFPDADRAYFKEEQRLAGVEHKKAAAVIRAEQTEEKYDPLSRTVVERKESAHMNGILSKILESSPAVLTFEPEDDREGVPINIIPEEVLLCILRKLDTTTLERFATVSRKARVLSLDSSLWRDFVYLAYKPPQIPEAVTVQAIVDDYDSNYRRTYIQHPRLRLDGVYIAVCHYVRAGLSENARVTVNHLVTYHRYLRFFPDGQVLSLLANEEYHPALVIPMLEPSLRMKGFHIGDWRLEGTSVLITNLAEQHPRTHLSAHPAHHSHVQPPPARYHFQMSLSLRSKPLGRWNKLDFASYASVGVEDGEVVPLPLKHQRPFWFSKVKSWQGF